MFHRFAIFSMMKHGDRIVVMFALIDRIIAIAIAVGGCRFGPWARERSSQIAVPTPSQVVSVVVVAAVVDMNREVWCDVC